MSDSTVFDRLAAFLTEHHAEFDVLEHEPVFTSEEAAEVRGTPLSSGAKSLICKMGQQFVMFVLPADRRLASKKVRQALGVRSLRFANRDEVREVTSRDSNAGDACAGLEPGSIPPFGSLFNLPTYCDERLANEPVINFNAGDHARSISMSYADFHRVEQPETGRFAE